MPITKEEVIPFLIQQLEKQQFTNIKAKTQSHKTPKGVKWESGAQAKIPDLTAEKQEGLGIFSIVENTETIDAEQLDTYRLFSTYSSRMKGRHFLVVHKAQESKMETICEQHKLKAEILSVEKKTQG